MSSSPALWFSAWERMARAAVEISISRRPASAHPHLGIDLAIASTGSFYLQSLGLGILVLGFLACWTRQAGRKGFTAVALAGHVILFMAVGYIYCSLPSRYPNDWQLPTRLAAGSDPPLTRYEIFHLPAGDSNPSTAFWLFFRPGNTNLERPGISIPTAIPHFS